MTGQLDIRIGDVWRRKHNGRLVTVTNPRHAVGANYHDIQYLIQADGRMGYTSSLYWDSSFELVERGGQKLDRDEIQLGNTLAYALESDYGHEQLARLVLAWMKAHGYEKRDQSASQRVTEVLGTDDWVIVHRGHQLVTEGDLDRMEAQR